MPLAILCGRPGSGKTTLAVALYQYLSTHCDNDIRIVRDHSATCSAYKDSKSEKMARGALKGSVEQCLSSKSIVIVDSLNHNKGFRYELFCIAKSQQTPHCVVYLDPTLDEQIAWNSQRLTDKWDEDLLRDISNRHEIPNARNRWDSPLFHVTGSDYPLHSIYEALVHGRAPKAGQATLAKNVGQSNFVHELSHITRTIQDSLLASSRKMEGGDFISVPGTSKQIFAPETVSVQLIKRLRRQFIHIAQLNPPAIASISTLFVDYINENLSG